MSEPTPAPDAAALTPTPDEIEALCNVILSDEGSLNRGAAYEDGFARGLAAAYRLAGPRLLRAAVAALTVTECLDVAHGLRVCTNPEAPNADEARTRAADILVTAAARADGRTP